MLCDDVIISACGEGGWGRNMTAVRAGSKGREPVKLWEKVQAQNPPRELQPMFETGLTPLLTGRTAGRRLHRRTIKITGRSESQVEEIAHPIYSRLSDEALVVETTILATPGQIELHLSAAGADAAAMAGEFEQFGRGLGMNPKVARSDRRPRVVLFVSKFDHCFHDLILRWKSGDYDADFVAVVSNHSDLAEASRGYGLPYYHIPVTAATKAEADAYGREAAERLALISVDPSNNPCPDAIPAELWPGAPDKEAEALAKASIFQATSEKKLWKDMEIR